MQQRGVARGCPHLSRRSVAKTEPQRRSTDDDVPFNRPHELNDAVSSICPQAESAWGYRTQSQMPKKSKTFSCNESVFLIDYY